MNSMALTAGIMVGLAAALCWGVADFLAKTIIDRLGADGDLKALFWTRLFGLIPVFTLFFSTGAYLGFSVGILPMLLTLGLLNFSAYYAFYRGIKKGEVSIVSPIVSSSALVTVLLGVLFMGEVLDAARLAGVIALLIGVPLISLDLQRLRVARMNGLSAGTPEALIAMLCWGIMWALVGSWGKGLGWLLPIVGIRTTTFLLVSASSAAKGLRLGEGISVALPVLAATGLLDASGYLLSSWAMSTELVSIVAPLSCTFPAITVLLAIRFLKERLAPNQVAGVIATIAGVVLLSR